MKKFDITHPDFRRRGIGAALLAESAQHALKTHDLVSLAIVAEEKSGAKGKR